MKKIKDILIGNADSFENIQNNNYFRKSYKELDILGKEFLLNAGLSFVLSQPGVGKTTLSLDIVLEQVLKNDISIFIFSSEKRAEEIAKRLTGKVSGDILRGFKEKFFNVCIEDFADGPKDAVSKIKSLMKTTCANSFVFIDFLSCLWTNGRGRKITFEERERFCCELSELAKMNNIKLLVSDYITKEDYDLIVCGKFPPYLKSANAILILDRQSFFTNNEFYTKAELQIISPSNTKTEIELDYDGISRRFVRR